MYKMIQVDYSESDKKIRRLVILGIRPWFHPKHTDTRSDFATVLGNRVPHQV